LTATPDRVLPGMQLRQRWAAGEQTLGGWCSIPSAFSAEVMGHAGFDWVCIDTQHGLIAYQQMLGMLQALAVTRTPTLVRVAWNSPAEIMKALDAGAAGVIVPMINSLADAEAAVGACRYPPDGWRSWGPTRAALGWPGYSPEEANRSTICVVMVERYEAFAHLDEILEVSGVDGLFIGPNDLALASGMAPDLTASEPRHRRQIDVVLAACRRRGVVAGIYCGGAKMARVWLDAGFQMIAVQNDAMLLRLGAEREVRELRGGEPRAEPRAPSGYS
jgi:4-hydroxy-2-oxoheptanedioate aldolase